MWIGIFIDVEHKALYFCPIPTIGLKIYVVEYAICPMCGQKLKKMAHNTGDGWALFWECLADAEICFDDPIYLDVEWPFGDRLMNAKDLQKYGFEIV